MAMCGGTSSRRKSFCTGEPDDTEWAAEVIAKLLFYAEKFALTGLDITYEWLAEMDPTDYAPFLRIFCTMSWAPLVCPL